MEVPDTAQPKARRSHSNIYIFASFPPSSIQVAKMFRLNSQQGLQGCRKVSFQLIDIFYLKNQTRHFQLYPFVGHLPTCMAR